MSNPEFQSFTKIARLNREVVVTEKIDGTNGLVYVPEDGGPILAGSRSRWITPVDDNFGFARWGDPEKRPACCHVVPEIARGMDIRETTERALTALRTGGSFAAPGFMKPEGVVIYHTVWGELFKVTPEKDAEPKGKAA